MINLVKEIEKIDPTKFQEAMKKMDECLEKNLEASKLMHQFKLSLTLEHYKKVHKDPNWIETIPKKEAKELFDQFLKLHENAFGHKFDHYDRMRREYHFTNWKIFLRTDFEKRELD